MIEAGSKAFRMIPHYRFACCKCTEKDMLTTEVIHRIENVKSLKRRPIKESQLHMPPTEGHPSPLRLIFIV